MSLVERFGTTLVIAPHPDDEVLGCGGVMARLAKAGTPVDVAIMTQGKPPAYPKEQVEQVAAEARAAHAVLGVRETHFLDFPAAQLDQVPQAQINGGMRDLILEVEPETILVPFVGDIHVDHQIIFNAAMVASRPAGGFRPSRILAYETLSETNWDAPYLTPAFTPNVFISIDGFLEKKINAFKQFGSQCRDFPNERSIRALTALAELRGACVNNPAAEAFVLVREIDG